MKKIKIAIINGPNINILGKREINVYGKESWSEIENKLVRLSEQLDFDFLLYQSNHQGDIVDFLQDNMDELSGVVINPASFSKIGYSILDALNSLNTPYIEVHLTNIVSRGGWHSESIFTEDAIGFIAGFKGYIYELGISAILNYIKGSQI